MKCNGCGGEIEYESFTDNELGGVFAYGDAQPPRQPDYAQHYDEGEIQDMAQAEYHRTLCEKCADVVKKMLLNSDLSEHWREE